MNSSYRKVASLFLAAEMRQLPRCLWNLTSKAELERVLADQIQSDLCHGTGAEFANAFSRRCPVPGVPGLQYANQLIDLGEGEYALVGIRFRNLDVSRPFAEVLHTTDERVNLPRVSRKIWEAYRVFRPGWLRAFAWNAQAQPVYIEDGAVPGKRLYVGAIDEMRKRRPPSALPAVRLQVLTNMSFYDFYVAEYMAFLSGRPDLVDDVAPEDPLDLARTLSERLLFQVSYHGEFAGIMAARLCAERGIYGYCIIEEFLFAPFRGQGLGAACQRLLIETLDPKVSKLVHGTISPKNLAALKVAEANGRKDMGGFVWVPLTQPT